MGVTFFDRFRPRPAALDIARSGDSGLIAAIHAGAFHRGWTMPEIDGMLADPAIVAEVARAGKLPVVLFTAGGIATPADAAMMMQLGAEGVFVGSGIFKSGNPAQRAEAIVKATTFYDDPDTIARVSRGLGEAMVGINVDDIPAPHRLAERGW